MKEKIEGCLLGGAIGDALGYPVEFIYSFRDIAKEYGEGGIRDYDLRYPWMGKKCSYAQISDDTQMTIYTANALLQSEKEGISFLDCIRHNYLGWYFNQVGLPIPLKYKSNLTEIEELNQRRAPGTTCLTALQALSVGKEVKNDSKGCGGIMRVAPVGIWGATHDWEDEKIIRTAAEVAEITHLHPLSSYSSAALAMIIKDCLLRSSVSLDDFIIITRNCLASLQSYYGSEGSYMNFFQNIINKALDLIDNLAPDWEIIEKELGGGWVAEETLAIAIFCVGRHIDNFRESVISSVNHGGDSDSTGAVAGNLIGAILGKKAIPTEMITSLQLTDLLLKISQEMI